MSFQKGVSGNPAGRPRGLSDKRTALRNLLKPHAEDLVNKAVQLAKQGDVQALRLCIERLVPKAKDEPINLTLPDIQLNSVVGVLDLETQVIERVANGELTPEQGQKLSVLLECHRHTIEYVEIETRLKALEDLMR